MQIDCETEAKTVRYHGDSFRCDNGVDGDSDTIENHFTPDDDSAGGRVLFHEGELVLTDKRDK